MKQIKITSIKIKHGNILTGKTTKMKQIEKTHSVKQVGGLFIATTKVTR